ncbi:HMG box protein [Colletotrichum truncatum]|uniref:HMG box protein n=1 Tax=Colletotrichum truncatum TaxID=5467 RepID=A0ACC3Z6W7_COLTU|nr:HMG box protein [Colletotrichum truncatum]KAF6781278.1 HMG box protein [Colletotrichum truncatum]
MDYPQHDTPTKARVLGTISYLERYKIPYFKSRVFEHAGVSHRQGWQILNEGRARRHNGDTQTTERRGRKKVLSKEDLQAMEDLVWSRDFEAAALTWQSLAWEAGIHTSCSWRTIQRAIGTLGYRKCITCDKGWVSSDTAARRVKDAQVALEKRPRPQDWHDVRFADELLFSIGPQGKARIIRKPGERYCPECTQDRVLPKQKDVKRLHAWAAVGHGFKSSLIFYEGPTNTNGKISHQAYRDSVLEPVVGSWIDASHQFVLEEDGDSKNGLGSDGIVEKWKDEHGLKRYLNTPQSPDLSVMEDCWKALKAQIGERDTWDVNELKKLVIFGWDRVEQKTIDQWVESMTQRMRDVISCEGRMTER